MEKFTKCKIVLTEKENIRIFLNKFLDNKYRENLESFSAELEFVPKLTSCVKWSHNFRKTLKSWEKRFTKLKIHDYEVNEMSARDPFNFTNFKFDKEKEITSEFLSKYDNLKASLLSEIDDCAKIVSEFRASKTNDLQIISDLEIPALKKRKLERVINVIDGSEDFVEIRQHFDEVPNQKRIAKNRLDKIERLKRDVATLETNFKKIQKSSLEKDKQFTQVLSELKEYIEKISKMAISFLFQSEKFSNYLMQEKKSLPFNYLSKDINQLFQPNTLNISMYLKGKYANREKTSILDLNIWEFIKANCLLQKAEIIYPQNLHWMLQKDYVILFVMEPVSSLVILKKVYGIGWEFCFLEGRDQKIEDTLDLFFGMYFDKKKNYKFLKRFFHQKFHNDKPKILWLIQMAELFILNKENGKPFQDQVHDYTEHINLVLYCIETLKINEEQLPFKMEEKYETVIL